MSLTTMQMRNLDKLPLSDRLEILDYILNESLGLMIVNEYIDYTKIPKATVYYKIKKKELKTIEILGTIGIIMNVK